MTDLRDALRAARNTDLTAVDVPEWGEKVYIRKLTVGDQLALESETDSTALLGIKVLLHAIVDENGERRLSDEDLPLLLEQPVTTLIPLLMESAKQNGQTKADLEEMMAAFGKARDVLRSTDLPSLSGEPSENSKPSPVPN